MNAAGRRRLLKLADFLVEQVPPKKFYMYRWATSDDLNECGATACAFGWAAMIPSFRRAGLSIRGKWPKLEGFRSRCGFKIAARFFSISNENSRDLFGSQIGLQRETPRQAAKRIRTFVAEQAKVTA